MFHFNHRVALTATTVTSILLASATPTHASERVILPSQAKVLLDDLKADGGRSKLVRFLSPEVTEIIEDYARLHDDDVMDPHGPVAATPAMYGAAVVGGATAAVVEWAYDKYVGKRTDPLPGIDDAQFDLIRKRVYPKPATKWTPQQTTHHRGLIRRGENESWGMVVGTAAAGALGYKMAEHALREYGAVLPRDLEMSERQFDLTR